MNLDLYNIILHLHSVGRWIMLLLLVIAIFNSMVAAGRPFIKSDARTGLLLVIAADLMLIAGGYLWYVGSWGYKQIETRGMSEIMKDSTARFFVVEHFTGMLIAIILIHIGKMQARKKIGDKAKHRRTVIYYGIALLIILISVPWPFRHVGLGSHWF